MTAVGGEILWVSVGLVCRSVWITDVPLEDDCGVQEGDTFGGVLTCKFDGCVEVIYLFKEDIQCLLAMLPDCKHIVDIAPPDDHAISKTS